MGKIRYAARGFNEIKLKAIKYINAVLDDYAEQGYDLTLRQVFYSFVSRGLLTNTEKSYKWLGDVLADARIAGLVDWDYVVDRTRMVRMNNHWDHPADTVEHMSKIYANDLWEDQPNYVETWIEKDALVGILQAACSPLDVPYFSCRGYTSITGIHDASLRIRAQINKGKQAHIVHLGDHDPSGIDMTRDITDRLNNVFQVNCIVHRVALNWDQIQQYKPPPNPAKVSDSRAKKYIDKYGVHSWELDALEPRVLVETIRTALWNLCDRKKFEEAKKRQERGRHTLQVIRKRWKEVMTVLRTPSKETA